MAATSCFVEISKQFFNNLLDNSIPEKTKKATKYGMKIFPGNWTKLWLFKTNSKQIKLYFFRCLFNILSLFCSENKNGEQFTCFKSKKYVNYWLNTYPSDWELLGMKWQEQQEDNPKGDNCYLGNIVPIVKSTLIPSFNSASTQIICFSLTTLTLCSSTKQPWKPSWLWNEEL